MLAKVSLWTVSLVLKAALLSASAPSATFSVQQKPGPGIELKPIAKITRNLDRIGRPVFTPDSKVLAAYSRTDDRIRFWEPTTGKELADLSIGEEYGNGAIAFSVDGSLVASTHWGWNKHGMGLWDTRTKRALARVDGTYNPRGLAFSPDGKLVAFVDAQHLYLFGVEKRKILHKLPNKDGGFSTPVFSPDSKKLAVTGAVGRRLQIFDCERAVQERTIQVTVVSEQSHFQSVHWTKDGKTIIALGPKALTFWHLETENKTKQMDALTEEKLGDLSVSPDERYVATGTVKGNMVIWDLKTLKQTMYLGSQFPAFSPDGKMLAVVSDSEIRVWDFFALINR